VILCPPLFPFPEFRPPNVRCSGIISFRIFASSSLFTFLPRFFLGCFSWCCSDSGTPLFDPPRNCWSFPFAFKIPPRVPFHPIFSSPPPVQLYRRRKILEPFTFFSSLTPFFFPATSNRYGQGSSSFWQGNFLSPLPSFPSY